MDIIQQDGRAKPEKKTSRRRKKRRTDVSSDSESSSSSDEAVNDDNNTQKQSETDMDNSNSGTGGGTNNLISQLTTERIRKLTNKQEAEELNAAIQARLRQVPFKTQEPAATDDKEERSKAKLVRKHTQDREELDRKFLQLMTEQFGDQLDKLRNDPTFSSKSLMVIAQMLESGNNLFDEDEIKALLDLNRGPE